MRQSKIWGALCDLVPCAQFKKREKDPWRSITFSKVAKSNTPPWVFFMFFKLYKWYQIAQRTKYVEDSLFILKYFVPNVRPKLVIHKRGLL